MSRQNFRSKRSQNVKKLPANLSSQYGSLPVDPVQFLEETPTKPKHGTLKFSAIAAAGVFCMVEFFQPFGFSPLTAIGIAAGNFIEPVRQSERQAQLCFDEQQQLAQRLAEAERDYADAMGQCTILSSVGGVWDPGFATQLQTICQNAVEQRFQTELRQLREARDRARECQL